MNIYIVMRLADAWVIPFDDEQEYRNWLIAHLLSVSSLSEEDWRSLHTRILENQVRQHGKFLANKVTI